MRVSGEAAREIALRLFEAASADRKPKAGGRPCFGRFLGRDGRALDHGYLVLFAASGSYTGELTAELWPHGSPAVLAELVEAAVAAGAMPAGPGEFTYRALRHGRVDLARSEAVNDLVEARTLYQARIAFAQAEGAVSKRVAPLREALEEWIARGEAAVEFVDESETHLPDGTLVQAIAETRGACAGLLAGFRAGRVVREGAIVVITGRPNVGKSTLFNRLLGRERAIVTDIPGTTRDTLEEDLALDGIPVRLVDTAGMREAQDPVESEGIRRANLAREEADLTLLVLEGTRRMDSIERETLERDDGEKTVVVLNKCDQEVVPGASPEGGKALHVSARSGEGLDRLREELRGRLLGGPTAEDPIITNARHARALELTLEALDHAVQAGEQGLTEELVLEDLKLARRHLGEITGEFGAEDLFDRIFSSFCIGK